VADKLLLGAKENVGFRVREGDHWRYFTSPALCTPHADYGGQLVGLKYRAMSEKAFRQEDGSTIHGLYAMHCLDRQADEVLVLEGDKDTAIALSHGFNATCILSAQSELSDADVTLLTHYDRVYLIGDEDGGAGVEAMDKLAKRWPNDRAIRIHLPVKDVGELYAQSPAEFKDRLTAILHNTKGASA
jgi:DNA primase